MKGIYLKKTGKESRLINLKKINLIKENYLNKKIYKLIKEKVIVKANGNIFKINKRYQFIKKLGVGSYGFVIMVKDNIDNKNYAIKKVSNLFNNLIDSKRILRELKLLNFINHDNIINLERIEIPESEFNFEEIYMIFEFFELDLNKIIISKQKLNEYHIKYLLYQIVKGIHFIHSANIIHRDLKPSNILVDKYCKLKICDLGLGRGNIDNSNISQNNLTNAVVTRWYRAPEILINQNHYGKSIDIWSIGCIMAELYGRIPLFQGENNIDQINKIITLLGKPKKEDLIPFNSKEFFKYYNSLPEIPKQNLKNIFININNDGIDLLERLLSFSPNKRPNTEEILNHKYFNDIRNKDTEKISLEKFDWEFDNFELTKHNLQTKIYNESLKKL